MAIPNNNTKKTPNQMFGSGGEVKMEKMAEVDQTRTKACRNMRAIIFVSSIVYNRAK